MSNNNLFLNADSNPSMVQSIQDSLLGRHYRRTWLNVASRVSLWVSVLDLSHTSCGLETRSQPPPWFPVCKMGSGVDGKAM